MNRIQTFLVPLLALFLSLATVSESRAESFSKYVGETVYLPLPKAPMSNAAITQAVYSCSSSNVNMENSGKMMGTATIVKYFEGSVTIECYFQYTYVQGTTMRTGTSREYHTLRCNSNDISISGARSTMKVGEGMQMSYKFAHYTYDATPQITWNCGSSCASVDYSGYVTARSEGTAVITARSNLGGNVAQYTIRIEGGKPSGPTGFTIKGSEIELKVGDSRKLDYSFTPSGTSSPLTWSSSDKSVATVSSGTVKAVSEGTATITARTENGLSDQIRVKVVSKSSGGSSSGDEDGVKVSLPSKADAYVGYGLQLKAEIDTDDSSPSMKWSSSDTGVARVSSSGFVTAVKTGTATITCTLSNGNSATCDVKVAPAPDNFDADNVKSRISILKSRANALINLLK